MNEFDLKMAILAKKINDKTIQLDDLNLSVLDLIEESINYTGDILGINGYYNIKLWTSFKKDIDKGLTLKSVKKYAIDLEKSFSYMSQYLTRITSCSKTLELIITMQGVIKSLEIIQESYEVTEALIN